MKKNKHYVGQITKYLKEKLQKDVCDTVFVGHRPSAVDENMEFIVIRTSKSIFDHDVYQQSSMYFDIYVRNLEGGLEDTEKLQSILDSLEVIFPLVVKYDKEKAWRWSVTQPQLVISGDDMLGFTAWGIRARLMVNTTDNFIM